MAEEITLEIRVAKSLADRVGELLMERGLRLDQAVSLYLRGMVNASATSRSLRLADPMPFGKYKDEAIETIVRGDPGYMLFILGLGKTRLDPEVLALMETLDSERV